MVAYIEKKGRGLTKEEVRAYTKRALPEYERSVRNYKNSEMLTQCQFDATTISTYNKGGRNMHQMIEKLMEEGNMRAIYDAIRNDGTMGTGGENLSRRRAQEAALFARDGFGPVDSTTNIIVDPVEVQHPGIETCEITPGPRLQSPQTLFNLQESSRDTPKLAWEKDTNYSGRTPSARVGGGEVFGTAAIGGAIGAVIGGGGTIAVGSTTVTVGVAVSSTGTQLAVAVAVVNPFVALGILGTLVVVGISAGVAAARSRREEE